MTSTGMDEATAKSHIADAIADILQDFQKQLKVVEGSISTIVTQSIAATMAAIAAKNDGPLVSRAETKAMDDKLDQILQQMNFSATTAGTPERHKKHPDHKTTPNRFNPTEDIFPDTPTVMMTPPTTSMELNELSSATSDQDSEGRGLNVPFEPSKWLLVFKPNE